MSLGNPQQPETLKYTLILEDYLVGVGRWICKKELQVIQGEIR